MTKQLLLQETRWYLSLQDGPADNEAYDTKAEADAALKKLPKDSRRGMYVTSRTITTPFP